LVTVTLAQLVPALPRLDTTKVQDGKAPVKDIFPPRQVTTPLPPLWAKDVLGGLSFIRAHSMPVLAAKKASLELRAEELNFISFKATVATPKAIDKIILDTVTAKSITNPDFNF
jgi:hypothetical protein